MPGGSPIRHLQRLHWARSSRLALMPLAVGLVPYAALLLHDRMGGGAVPAPRPAVYALPAPPPGMEMAEVGERTEAFGFGYVHYRSAARSRAS